MSVDGREQRARGGEHWQFVPLHLAAGLHKLRLVSRKRHVTQLGLRFGLRGTTKVEGKRFKHGVEAAKKRDGAE